MNSKFPSRVVLAALAALVPAAANAACEPSFVDGTNSVRLTPPASLESGQLTETFIVRVRNAGDDACVLRLGVGRNGLRSTQHFPPYSLSGPDGNMPVPALAGDFDSADLGREFTVSPGGLVSLSYNVRMVVGWGIEAGNYSEDLVFQLFDGRPGRPLLTQTAQLLLEIPKMALIRFAGASGIGGPAVIDMGPLSANAPTRSPPFALRIVSTSGYRMDLASENNGSLRQSGSSYSIPYELTVHGKNLDLSSGSDPIQSLRHTSSAGDVHPVMIVVQPDPVYPAGDYSDRITITVTAI